MNEDLAAIGEALCQAGAKCACITLADGRTLEIDCSCRCKTGAKDIEDPYLGGP